MRIEPHDMRLNHMTKTCTEEINVTPNFYMIPIYVFILCSSKTKLCVLFDASIKISNNKYLNVLCTMHKI